MPIDSRINGSTKLIGVIGNPIEHSISPQIHNTISSNLGHNMVYVPFKVDSKELENAVKGLKALNFIGFNITIPFKKDVIKYLDETSKEALMMGAVNTVKNIDGRLYGYNTDAEGFARSFREEAGTGFRSKRIVMIGAGGAARAMAVKMAMEGAEKVDIINRTATNAQDILEIVNNNINNIAKCFSFDDKAAKEAFSNADIIINTTPVGMYPEVDNTPVGKAFKFSSNQIVYDAIYNPNRTKLLKEAEKKGCKVINGLGMLFYQGVYAYEIWTGIKLPEELVKNIFRSELPLILSEPKC